MQCLANTIKNIAILIGAEVLGAETTAKIEHYITDSRKLFHPDNSVFVALKTSSGNGHDFIKATYANGIRCFLVSERPINILEEATYLLVENTLEALQKIASAHRKGFFLPVAAITGSNGKTVVKEWLDHLLHDDFNIVRSPQSFNSQIGVALSLLQIQKKHTLGIFEAGISKPGEMKKLATMIQPDLGIFTHLGPAHLSGFENMEQLVSEKFKLFDSCDVLVCCKDNPLVAAEASKLIQKNPLTKWVSWSRAEKATVKLTETLLQENGCTLTLVYRSSPIEVFIPFQDKASIENSITCFCSLLALEKLSPETINRFASLPPLKMRLEAKVAINHCELINDSYSNDLDSLSVALDFLNKQIPTNSRTVILSDIVQSGEQPETLYSKVNKLLNAAKVTRLIGIGPDIKSNKSVFTIPNSRFYFDVASFMADKENFSFQRENILLKGARHFSFEKIARNIEKLKHQTTLEINLSAMAQNIRSFKSMLKPGTKLMGMVKAFSYGSGTYETANLLQFSGADYLAVAFADEGVALRETGIVLPIMVLNSDEASVEILAEYGLEPVVYSLKQLQLLKQSNLALQIHIELDTGMHRLGFMPHEIEGLCKSITKGALKVASVFSHLSASDESVYNDFTTGQINKFNSMAAKIELAIGHPVLKHIANTAGIMNHPNSHFNMVRLGIGLFGIDPSGKNNTLEQVITFKTRITQIKTIEAGDSVGYSRKSISDKKRSIAIIPVGYADGYNRKLGNGAVCVSINGQLAPTAGNICMDMCMVDVSCIECQEGDEVVLFGDSPTVEQIAEAANTIPYEIFTGISQRVKRVYFE